MAAPRILIVGGGFAGMEAAHKLQKLLKPGEARLILASPFDYQLYLPLLPQVASGVLTPQAVAVALRRILRHTELLPGGAVGIDTDAKAVVVKKITGELVVEPYDYLVLAPGSVTRKFDVPGLEEYGVGVKNLAEAMWIRDHVIGQLDLAAASTDLEEQQSRLRFLVVGGGYAGTETAACLQRLTTAAAKAYRGLNPDLIKWHLVDVAPKLMPELGDELGEKALEIMRRRGVDVALGVSVKEITRDTVTLTDGRVLPCRTVIWTAGVAPSPLIATLDAPTNRGRLVVTPELTVPGLPGVFALGDAAAVPDIAVGGDAICPPTAQHAMRQGWAVARNVVATLRGEPLKPYKHKDLGLVVDLGGIDAVSKPLGIPLVGLPAQLVARGYHLAALRTVTARVRTVANWALNAIAGDDFVRIGFPKPKTLTKFELTDVYLTAEETRKAVAMYLGDDAHAHEHAG
ncbi:NAD(P)/FAD-dependent oxidoreductase [Streptomyces polyrhachis]|uniref:NAD(P)/FAD-dependent oxidoreductase n=1 Tax=Streptomyces polyrhachis TaxID=1282885 RepID=A0ABW2GF76_9ACTN